MTTAHGYRDASNTLQHGQVFSTASYDAAGRRITKAIIGISPWCRRPRRPSLPRWAITANINRATNEHRITKAIVGITTASKLQFDTANVAGNIPAGAITNSAIRGNDSVVITAAGTSRLAIGGPLQTINAKKECKKGSACAFAFAQK